jgi:hypothetical protein
MKAILFVAVALFCADGFAAEAAQPSPVKVAVANFEARGVSEADAAALAERFAAELAATGKFFVVERARMVEIFKQAAFEQSWCNDTSCAKAIGKLVAVDKMVLGSVARVGSMYTVNIRVTSVETGAVEKNFSEDCDCSIEELLTGTLRRIARKLGGVPGGLEGAIVSLQKGDAAVFVKSVPDSARVLVDGRFMEGTTPLSVQGVPPGRHDVRVQKGDLAASAIVTLSSNRIKKLLLKMSKQKTALKVLTDPTEAEVYIDGRFSRSKWPDQMSPAIFDNIAKDSLTVSLFRPGYLDTTLLVAVIPNKENFVGVHLVKADEGTEKIQRRLIRERGLRRLGLRLSLASLALAAGGGVSAILAQKDYNEALDAKTRLDQASVRDAAYDALVSENGKKTSSGNTKSYIGYGLFGAAVTAAAVGLVLYF